MVPDTRLLTHAVFECTQSGRHVLYNFPLTPRAPQTPPSCHSRRSVKSRLRKLLLSCFGHPALGNGASRTFSPCFLGMALCVVEQACRVAPGAACAHGDVLLDGRCSGLPSCLPGVWASVGATSSLVSPSPFLSDVVWRVLTSTEGKGDIKEREWERKK